MDHGTPIEEPKTKFFANLLFVNTRRGKPTARRVSCVYLSVGFVLHFSPPNQELS
jgi:hypothetical protein